MELLTYLVVEDETHAAIHLQHLIEQHFPAMHCTGMAATLAEAVQLIGQTAPDIIFLDLHLGDSFGLDLIPLLPESRFHLVVVSGHEQYAMKALKASAVDYLLKPVTPADLQHAMARVHNARINRQGGDGRTDLIHLMKTLYKSHAMEYYRLPVSVNGEQWLIKPAEIIRLEAKGSYTDIYLQSGLKPLIPRGMYTFESKLLPLGFIRCHSSHLVNPRHVLKTLNGHGIMELLLSNNDRVLVARALHKAVKQALDDFKDW